MIELSLQKKLDAADGEMLLNVRCSIVPGTVLTLFGESGAGKTSILRIMAGLDRPTTGSVIVKGQDVTGISVRRRSVARGKEIASFDMLV